MITIFSASFLLLTWLLPPSDGLWCYCDVKYCVDNNVDACETNGSCVTSFSPFTYETIASCRHDFVPDNNSFQNADSCTFPEISQLGMRLPSMCCVDKDFCNKRFIPTTTALATNSTPLPEEQVDYGRIVNISVAVIVAVIALVFIVIGVIVISRRIWKNRHDGRASAATSVTTEMADICMSSGSGHGVPMLAERTVAREVSFKDEIGKGRYGTVWCGNWRDIPVAVKTFDPRESDSWMREVEIYQTHMLNHANILHFIASDSRDKGAFTQFLLITEYHGKGSLFDYLNENVLDVAVMTGFSVSITEGLNYLHKEIIANRVKPCIAHRDLKSKNILVKDDNTCCIADLGLAVRHDSTTGGVDIAVTNRVGTKRYMAPEVLDESIIVSSINSFKMADIYSLALVFWELLRRCRIRGKVDDYELPYYDRVSEDPNLDEMRNAVCIENYRPKIPDRIVEHEVKFRIEAQGEADGGNEVIIDTDVIPDGIVGPVMLAPKARSQIYVVAALKKPQEN